MKICFSICGALKRYHKQLFMFQQIRSVLSYTMFTSSTSFSCFAFFFAFLFIFSLNQSATISIFTHCDYLSLNVCFYLSRSPSDRLSRSLSPYIYIYIYMERERGGDIHMYVFRELLKRCEDR